MKSKFAIAGHPLHPMLVVVPIGLFAWTLISDLVYFASDSNQMWYDIAFWTDIAAIVSALIAALPGIGDYLTVAARSDSRGIATAHGVLNVIVVLLYTAAMLLMLDNGATDGAELTAVIVLHAVGVGLLVVSGWLGGEMVYRHHIGILPDTEGGERAEYERHARKPIWAEREQ